MVKIKTEISRQISISNWNFYSPHYQVLNMQKLNTKYKKQAQCWPNTQILEDRAQKRKERKEGGEREEEQRRGKKNRRKKRRKEIKKMDKLKSLIR